jgi:UDP-N-acetylmuramate--alanine ligase
MTAVAQPWSGRRIHLIGVGGAGMSAYARAAHSLGAAVSGSDAASTPYLQELVADGVLTASVGHDVANLPDAEPVDVFYSSAIGEANVERAAARERGWPVRARADLLAELTALKRTIAVAGTHGKTTSSSMLVHALRGAGLRPSWLVGAPVGGGLANACWQDGEWLVVEADESDRSMLSLSVEIALLTNVELDHHATFSSLRELREAFSQFLSHARAAAVVWEGQGLTELARGAIDGAALVSFAMPDAHLGPDGSRFELHGERIVLPVPGAHNALNACGALEAARLAGADVALAAGALAGFHGAGRRFELVGSARGGARVYDDYAHHPSEIAATLAAARTLAPRRLLAVFQPHLYSRTEMLARELGAALAAADLVVVLDVYAARERAENHPGVSGLLVAEAAAVAAHGRPVYWLPTIADAQPALERMLGDGDLCLVMGAGDVDRLARALVDTTAGSDA